MFDLQPLKAASFDSGLKHAIPVRSSDGASIASLVPIGAWALQNDALLRDFAAWRSRFKKFFLTQTDVSVASTRAYLRDVSIPARDRILFALFVGDDLFGHAGLCNVTEGSAELDNILRGRSGGPSDLMFHAEKALLEWAFDTLGSREIVARVLSRNVLATTLHERSGFRLSGTQALKRVPIPDGFRFEPSDEGGATEGTHLNVLTLAAEDHRR